MVWPTSTSHVSEIANVCYDEAIPMTPFGTGTGLEGGVGAVKVYIHIKLTLLGNTVQVTGSEREGVYNSLYC